MRMVKVVNNASCACSTADYLQTGMQSSIESESYVWKNNFEKIRFSGKGRQSLNVIITHIMRIRKILISYVRLDHTLYSVNYDNLDLVQRESVVF